LPSRADILFTETMRRLGRHLGIEVIDHIIVAGGDAENLVSFRENNFFLNKKKKKKQHSSKGKC